MEEILTSVSTPSSAPASLDPTETFWTEDPVSEGYWRWYGDPVSVRGEKTWAGAWAERKLETVWRCGEDGSTLTRDCGHAQTVIHRCHTFLCADCSERDRLARLMQIAWAFIEQADLSNVRLITFTFNNAPPGWLKDAREQISKALQRWKELRLGKRAWKRWEREFWRELDASGLDEEQKALQVRLFEEMRRGLESYWARGESPKVRDLTRGFYTWEVAWNSREQTWHPHIHMVVEIPFPIPQILLTAMWRHCTRDAGRIVDIRLVPSDGIRKAIRYVGKYLTKPWLLPQDERLLQEALFAFKGIKKISAWRLEAIPKEERVCPKCGRKDCRARVVHPRVKFEERITPQVLYKMMWDDYRVRGWADVDGVPVEIEVFWDHATNTLSWRYVDPV